MRVNVVWLTMAAGLGELERFDEELIGRGSGPRRAGILREVVEDTGS